MGKFATLHVLRTEGSGHNGAHRIGGWSNKRIDIEIIRELSAGNYRVAHLIRQVSNGVLFVLKIVKRGKEREVDLNKDLSDSAKAAKLADSFDGGKKIKVAVGVLAKVEKCSDSTYAGKTVLVEPYLESSFEKWVLNSHHGGNQADHVLQAFFHHSFIASGESEVIWDLQGARMGGTYYLTDVEFISDRKTARKFFGECHSQCNGLCPSNKRRRIT